MAIVYKAYALEGLSGDTKPTTVPTNRKFFETDTGKFYTFNGATWDEDGQSVGSSQGDNTVLTITPNSDFGEFLIHDGNANVVKGTYNINAAGTRTIDSASTSGSDVVLYSRNDLSGWNVDYHTYTSANGSMQFLRWKDDGTKCYLLNNNSTGIYQYSASTAWDLSSLTYDSKTHTLGNTCKWFEFNADGSKLLAGGQSTDAIKRYTLSTPWDISTTSAQDSGQSFSILTQSADCNGGCIGGSTYGERFYISDDADAAIYQYNCTSAFDLTTMSYASKTMAVKHTDGSSAITAKGVDISDDGLHIWLHGLISAGTVRGIWRFDLSTAWELASGDEVATQFIDVSDTVTGTARGMSIKKDTEDKFYVAKETTLMHEFGMPATLSGTTGQDGKLTILADSDAGTIDVENRLGATRTISYKLTS